MTNIIYIISGIIIIIIGYFFTKFMFDVLLRGFAPFIPSRPQVIKKILSKVNYKQENPVILSLGCGRSGFLHAVEKKYPQAHLIGIENKWIPYLIAKLQLFFRKSKIKVIKKDIHKIDFRDADLVYCHLYPDQLDGLNKRLKFGCEHETKIISTGFNIPYMEPIKIIELENIKGRLAWMSKNREIFKSKRKKAKKLNKVYFYEII